jgi:hypothetical protein
LKSDPFPVTVSPREVLLAEWINMGTELLSDKYAAVMDGTLNCFDRVVLPSVTIMVRQSPPII